MMAFNVIQAHVAELRMVLVVSLVVTHIQASNAKDGTIFLERGSPGILSCPLVASRRIPPDQIEVIYWYSPVIRDENILISYFLGNVAPQNGIPEGVYDINVDFSLVIENVTDSDEGTYYCRVKPRMKVIADGHLNMRVKVSPKEPIPEVTQCTERISERACEAEFTNDIKKPMLTCIVRDTKPAVTLRWLLEYSDGDTQLISDRFTVKPSEYAMNTFTTSASNPVVPSTVDMLYRCQAYGEALGARNSSYMTVAAFYTPQTPDFTSLKPTTTVMMARFGETVKDNTHSSQNGPTWLIVVVCLSFAAYVGLCIAVYKLWKRMPGKRNEKENNNNEKSIREKREKETSWDSEASEPLNADIAV